MVTPLPSIATAIPAATGNVAASAMHPNMNAFVLGAGMLGTVMQSFGAYQEGQATAAALEFNAFQAEEDVKQVEKAKQHELHKAKTKRKRLLARQIAATAASGRQTSGSPLELMARAETEALRDEGIIRSNAAMAKGKLYGQAAHDKSRAKTAKSLGTSKALSNLFIGGANTYAKSNYFKSKGK